ncbi:MAG: G5 domain-containing protein [Actinomycetota bacterium]
MSSLEQQSPQRLADETVAQSMIARLQRRLWIERGVFIVTLVAILAAWGYPTFFPGVWAIYVQGRPLVAMRDRQEVSAVLDRVKRQYGDNPSGARFAKEVRLGRADPASVAITDQETAVEKLDAVWKLHADQALIYVDDAAVVALPSKEDASAVLERVKADLTTEVGELQVAPEFKQKVEVRVEPTTEDISADVETAVALLEGKDSDGSGVHRVESGQNAWSIARQHELSLAELKQLNPAARLDRLQVGQELKVAGMTEPLVTVTAEGRSSVEELIGYRTELRSSHNLYLGKRILLRAGKPGRARVTYRVRCENGKVVEREELERQVVSEPETKVVVLGLKARPRR